MVQRCVSTLHLSFNLASLVAPPGTLTLETPFVTYLRLTPVDPLRPSASQSMVSTTSDYLVDVPYWPSSIDPESVLLDVTDPTRHYLEGRIDNSSQSERHVRPRQP